LIVDNYDNLSRLNGRRCRTWVDTTRHGLWRGIRVWNPLLQLDTIR